jgi:hypothetical protein
MVIFILFSSLQRGPAFDLGFWSAVRKEPSNCIILVDHYFGGRIDHMLLVVGLMRRRA